MTTATMAMTEADVVAAVEDLLAVPWELDVPLGVKLMVETILADQIALVLVVLMEEVVVVVVVVDAVGVANVFL